MKPVIFGEILFDHFPDGSACLGGAPFNVAWHVHAFGGHPLMVSRIGEDGEGRRVLDAMSGWGMDTQGVQIDRVHPTGRVRVDLIDGDPSFVIETEQAYDFIDVTQVLAVPVQPAVLYHGTLAMRHPVSREALEKLRERLGCPVFLDINLRAPWWNPETLLHALEGATWIKLNGGELAQVSEQYDLSGTTPEAQAEAMLRRCGAECVVVTLGAEGAFAIDSAGATATVRPQRDITVVDSVGAGDAFSAGLLMGVIADWPLPLALQRAQTLAAAVCGIRGAVSRERDFYRKILDEWRTM